MGAPGICILDAGKPGGQVDLPYGSGSPEGTIAHRFFKIYLHILMYMPEVTTVRMRSDTKALLDDLKLNPRETYDDVVRRLARAAYDDEPLSPEEIEAMEEGIADIKAGRVSTLDEIMKECGDDTVIKARKL